LDEWLDEGRISAECQLQSDASPDWLPATQIFPQLLSPAATFTSSPSSGTGSAYSTSQQPNPYESFSHIQSRRYLRPHRSGQILTLGLLGFCCGFLGIFAWVMGHTDLREMREGRMDPSGSGTTRAGYILGIITTVLWAARLLGNVLERAF
jgi:hypothetical protein